jgi:hypothetical protein
VSKSGLCTWQGTPPTVAALIRRLRLLPVAYRAAFLVDYARNWRQNHRLKLQYPGVAFPPARLQWIVAPTTSYGMYLSGREAAERYYRLACDHGPHLSECSSGAPGSAG